MALRRLWTVQAKVHSAAALGLPRMDSWRKPHVVLDVAVGGLGDVAALAVGGDAVVGGEPGGHRRDRPAVRLSAGPPLPARAAFSRSRRLPVAMSRSGPGQVRLCLGAGSRRRRGPARSGAGPLPASCRRGGGRGAVRRDQGGGVLAPRRIIGSYQAHVGGVIGELGGDDQAVFAGDVLGVVALDEPAAADRHQPRVRVGDVADRAGLLAPRPGRALRAAARGLRPRSSAGRAWRTRQ